MLNMSIILIDINNLLQKFTMQYLMYYFLCKLITDLHNSIHFITGLTHMHKNSVRFGKKKSEVRRQKFLVRSFPSYGIDYSLSNML